MTVEGVSQYLAHGHGGEPLGVLDGEIDQEFLVFIEPDEGVDLRFTSGDAILFRVRRGCDVFGYRDEFVGEVDQILDLF